MREVANMSLFRICFMAAFCAVLFCPSAWAACSSPSGTTGKFIYNSDYHVIQYCDGTNWIETGRSLVSGTSDCSNPTRAPGTIIYNSDYSVMQYCNGAVWVSMGSIPFPLGDLGKVAHWRFNETGGTTAFDSVGPHDANLTNGPTWDTSGGVQGGAVVLDGTDDYVIVPYNSYIDPENFTVMMWVKPDVLEASALFLGAGGGGWTSTGGYRIQMSSSSGGVAIWCNDGTTNYNAGATNALNVGEWNFVAASYDGTNIKLYVNDVNQPGTATATCSRLTNQDIWIGRSWGVTEFEGEIDEVMLFDKALSATEINNAYVSSGAISSITSGLIGYWKLDETSGTTAKDSSGSGLDGTLVNGPTWAGTGGVVKGAINIDDATAMAVEIPYQSGIEPTTGVTYAAWVYLTNNNWYDVILNHKRDNDILRITNSTLPQFILRINGTTRTLTAPSALSLNRWYHIVGKYDGSEMALYVNGKKVSSAAYAGNIGTWSRGWEIGTDGEFYIAGETIEGYIDEVRIYNRGLSDAEVRQLMLYREYRPSTSCTSPSGSAGDMVYNNDREVMQYCNGWTWVSIGKKPLPPCGASPSPGDVCGDGTVYAGSLASGKRIYVAPVMNGTASWNNGDADYWQITDARSYSDGATNTRVMVNWTGNGAPLDAGHLCADYDAYGHDDWYLPAYDEFQILWDNHTAIDSSSSENFTAGKYWTSTEYSNAIAEQFNWWTGLWDTSGGKTASFYIRCVRTE